MLAAWGWHFSRPDRIEGADGWSLETRLFRPPDAPYRPPYDLPHSVAVLPNGVYLAVEASAGAQLSVHTNHGEFSLALAELASKGRIEFFDGDVHAVHTPPVRALTRGEASQHDVPAAAAIGDELFVAWTTYHNEANALYMAHQKAGKWITHRVTRQWADYYGTAIVADTDGLVHVLYGEYSGKRWRLVDRTFEPKTSRWHPERYVWAAAGKQMFPQAVADSAGKPWLVWQEFRGGNLDVMVSSWDGERWGEPLRISESAANDWAPSIAGAPDGAIWIAWDGYEAGNYDVFLRPIRGGRAAPVIQVTQAPTRDSYASVAVDNQNRVWVAWAEGGPNWGKDWGVLGRPGTQIRAGSRIRLARYANGRWMEPVQTLEEALPKWMADRHEYPRLATGSNGLPYLFFRKTKHRLPILEHALNVKLGAEERLLQPWYDTVRGMSSIQMTAFDGSGWLPTRELPLSEGTAFAQQAAIPLEDRLLVVWPTDGRTYRDPHARTSQIRYATFDPIGAPASTEAMRAFRSVPGGVEDASPTEAARGRSCRRGTSARLENLNEPAQLSTVELRRQLDTATAAEPYREPDIGTHARSGPPSLQGDLHQAGPLWRNAAVVLDSIDRQPSTPLVERRGGHTDLLGVLGDAQAARGLVLEGRRVPLHQLLATLGTCRHSGPSGHAGTISAVHADSHGARGRPSDAYAKDVLRVVRQLRDSIGNVDDLAWRGQATEVLQSIGATPEAILERLSASSAAKQLE